ncbi:MAG TPA: PLDc N-terminal domain-containing protein [Devosia sp.]
MTSSFWEFIYLILISFFLLAYLTVMFRIIVDLFRDDHLGGLAKALWIVGLFVLPFVTALVYVIARGQGMAERQHVEERQMTEAREAYIRRVAGTSPAEQIVQARKLLQDGAITEAEFAELKAHALGRGSAQPASGLAA